VYSDTILYVKTVKRMTAIAKVAYKRAFGED
jgi:hypothetical protein